MLKTDDDDGGTTTVTSVSFEDVLELLLKKNMFSKAVKS